MSHKSIAYTTLYSELLLRIHIIFVAENTEPAVNNSMEASESESMSTSSSLPPSSGAPGSLPSTSAGGSAPNRRQSLGSGRVLLPLPPTLPPGPRVTFPRGGLSLNLTNSGRGRGYSSHGRGAPYSSHGRAHVHSSHVHTHGQVYYGYGHRGHRHRGRGRGRGRVRPYPRSSPVVSFT